MKLVVITQPDFFVEEDKIISAFFEEGLDILHVRKPNSSSAYLERLLRLIPTRYHRQIVLHDHFPLKVEFNLMGVHLNSRNPCIPYGYQGHVSLSCHTFEEVKNQKEDYNYVFLSPIYDSISKEGYSSKFTPEDLRKAAKEGIIDTDVMALGGVNLDNLLEVKDYGFGGAVILGDLWSRFDLCKDEGYWDIIDHFKKLRKMAD